MSPYYVVSAADTRHQRNAAHSRIRKNTGQVFYVRYWHKADISQLHRTCPLLGVKRTWPFAMHMSAFDPKRTSRSIRIALANLVSAPIKALV